MSFSYPIFINLCDKKCLVVGGGKIAERKVMTLLDNGAEVYVVSPEITEGLRVALEKGRISVAERNYNSKDLSDIFMVIGATNQKEINQKIAQECKTKNILVNIVDSPQQCNFIVPSVVKKGHLTIAISTNGKSPMFARRLKEEFEANLGSEYEDFLDLMGRIREYVNNAVTDEAERKRIYYELVYSDLLELLREKKHDVVKERITHVLGSGWTQP